MAEDDMYEDMEALLAEEEAIRMEQEYDQYTYAEELMEATSTDAITPKASSSSSSSSSMVPAVYTPLTPTSSVVLSTQLPTFPVPGVHTASTKSTSKSPSSSDPKSRISLESSSVSNKHDLGTDLARRMQAERIAVLGHELQQSHHANPVTSNNLEVASRFCTLEPLFSQVSSKDVKTCLLEVPPNDLLHEEAWTCTLGNGDRFFLRSRVVNLDSTIISSDASKQSLLPKSIFELMKEADEIKVKAEVTRNLAMNRKLALEEEQSDYFAALTKETKAKELAAEKKKAKEDHRLWVDKYTPQSFSQLLSFEKTNREVLKALKKWDKFVFKRDIPNAESKENTEQDNELDEDFRPKNKVILLCGPPGTGKTTLANVCAKHCGYRVVEINASDDRSPEHLKELLARATQSTTLDQDKRPNLVIFDEIDGMDGNKQALEMLIEVIRAPLKQSNKGVKSNQKNGVFALTRPLICICNDQYAPVLRDLRKVSDIFVFQLPQETRLIQRLKHICMQEKIELSQAANHILTELIQATGHDIRSSINNLQFAALKMKNNEIQSSSSSGGRKQDLTSVIESMMKMGLKDDQLDSFQVWQKIFVKPVQKDGDVNLNNQGKRGGLKKEGMMIAFDAMVDHGDMIHILSGIHENMHKVSSTLHQDITGGTMAVMNRHCQSSDWLSLCDTFYGSVISGNQVTNNQVSYQEGGVQAMNFVALMAAAAHQCHATVGKQYVKLDWPRIDRDHFYTKTQRLNILQSVVESTNSLGVWTISKERIVLDVISCFIEIIRPRIRPLPMISLSVEEQDLIKRVAEVMETSGFSYIPITIETTNNKFFRNKFGFNSKNSNNNNNNNNNSYKNYAKGKGLADHSSVFLSESKISWVLDPNIELLVEFTDIEAMKEALKQNNSYQGNFSQKKVNFSNGVPKKSQHSVMSEDLKNTIYMEQRKYAIQLRENKVASLNQDVDKEDSENMDIAEEKPVIVKEQKVVAVEETKTSTAEEKEFNLTNKAHGLSSFFIKRPATDTASNGGANKKFKLGSEENKVNSKPTTSNTTSTTGKTLKSEVNFRFNQGYSNAVKRPVYISDFL